MASIEKTRGLSKCLVLNLDHGVEPIEQPDSIYDSNREWKCERCGQSFSEPHPTRMGDTCPFDHD